jgi:hypothetical protein
MFKKCKFCSKLLFFKSKQYNENFYCVKCASIAKEKDLEKHNEHIKDEKLRKVEQARIKKRSAERNKLADQNLLEELKRQKKKEQEKSRRKAEKLRLKLQKSTQITSIVKDHKTKKHTKKTYFDEETMDQHNKLLYIEANVKHLLAIEWIDKKKRIVLNTKREVRRTHAGGYSAEKFQKFVDFKKKKTNEWVISMLEKPGVLKPPYDIIKLESKDDQLKEELELYIKDYQK